MTELRQYPKDEVGFQSPSHEPGKECRDCTHFQVLHKNGCERVKGFIRPGDYCERFFNRKSKLAETMKTKGV